MHALPLPLCLALLAAPAASACVGGLDPLDDPPRAGDPPPAAPDAGVAQVGDDGARDLFVAEVAPILARCAGDACHTGAGSAPLKFLGPDPAGDFYESITQYPSVTGDFQPALANLLRKIDPGDHYGQRYTRDERDAVVGWLRAEATARGGDDSGGGDGGPPAPAGDPLAEWSGCMTKAAWDDAGMGEWHDKPSDRGPCRTCHNDGAFRFHTNDDNDTMFAMNRTRLYIIGFFTVRVQTDGSETVIPAYDKLERMGDGTTLHPRYEYDLGDEYMQRLDDFYQRTMQVRAAGACGPAEYPL